MKIRAHNTIRQSPITSMKKKNGCKLAAWLAVLRRSLTGGLSLIYAWSMVNMWPLRPLFVIQQGQLSLPFLRGQYMSSNLYNAFTFYIHIFLSWTTAVPSLVWVDSAGWPGTVLQRHLLPRCQLCERRGARLFQLADCLRDARTACHDRLAT